MEEEELPTPLAPSPPRSPPTSHPESSLAYSPPTMAAKRLNLPPVPSTVTSFPLSNAPLPTWWRRPSSSPSSQARDDDDGSDVHRCSCCRVVVVLVVMLVVVLLLSVVPSRRCCAATAAEPPTRPSTQLSLAIDITTATAVVTAVAVAFAAAIAVTIGVTIAAANNPIFWRAAKNTGVFLRPQTPLSYPSQNAETQRKSALLKHCEFHFKTTLTVLRRFCAERKVGAKLYIYLRRLHAFRFLRRNHIPLIEFPVQSHLMYYQLSPRAPIHQTNNYYCYWP